MPSFVLRMIPHGLPRYVPPDDDEWNALTKVRSKSSDLTVPPVFMGSSFLAPRLGDIHGELEHGEQRRTALLADLRPRRPGDRRDRA